MFHPDSDITRGQRRLMVSALEDMGKFSAKVLKALEAIPRHIFVDDALRDFAYENTPLAISAGQTISQPSTVAMQTTLLGDLSGRRILEIGTGCGYQTAVLYFLGAQVFSIERQEVLWRTAAKNLSDAGYCALPEEAAEEDVPVADELPAAESRPADVKINNNITLRWGDGYEGWPQEAPFDGIVVTCASPSIPEKLLVQLRVGGRMVIPVDAAGAPANAVSAAPMQQLLVIERIAEETFKRTVVENVSFVPMIPGTAR